MSCNQQRVQARPYTGGPGDPRPTSDVLKWIHVAMTNLCKHPVRVVDVDMLIQRSTGDSALNGLTALTLALISCLAQTDQIRQQQLPFQLVEMTSVGTRGEVGINGKDELRPKEE